MAAAAEREAAAGVGVVAAGGGGGGGLVEKNSACELGIFRPDLGRTFPKSPPHLRRVSSSPGAHLGEHTFKIIFFPAISFIITFYKIIHFVVFGWAM